jgi:hypothetical protein
MIVPVISIIPPDDVEIKEEENVDIPEDGQIIHEEREREPVEEIEIREAE